MNVSKFDRHILFKRIYINKKAALRLQNVYKIQILPVNIILKFHKFKEPDQQGDC
jgi:hypothetical protein